MSWSRFKQSTRETFKASKDDKTEIPSDIHSLFLKAEGVTQLYGELINKTMLYFPETKLKAKNADDPTKAQPLYQVGQTFEMLSTEYHQDYQMKQFFTQAKETMSHLARLKADLDKVAHQDFVDPKRSILQDHIKEAHTHNEKLKDRRLELDAHKHKLKQEMKTGEDGGKIKKYELEVSSSQTRFDTEVDAIRELLVPISNDAEMAEKQCLQTANLLTAMKRYFLESYQLLDQLDQKVNLETMQNRSTGSTVASHGTFLRSRAATTDPVDYATPETSRPRSTTSGGGTTPAVRLAAPAVPPPSMLSRVHSNSAGSSLPSAPPMAAAVMPKPNPATLPAAPAILAPKPSAYSSSSSSVTTAAAAVPLASGIAQRQEMLIRQLSQRVATSSTVTPAAAAAAAVEVCRSLFDFAGEQAGDLPLHRGDLIEIVDRSKGDWWTGRSQRTGRQGCFPSNYVEML